MNSSRTSSAAGCALAATMFVASAMTARAESRDEQAHACRSDALHFCMADVPHKAKITECMKRHYDQLSPECKAMFDKPDTPARPKD